LFVCGFCVDILLALVSIIIAISCNIEFDWFIGIAILLPIPNLLIYAISVHMPIVRPFFKYFPKFKWFSKSHGYYNNEHLLNPKLCFKIAILDYILIYFYLYILVGSFLPILLLYCGIDVNGIMLR